MDKTFCFIDGLQPDSASKKLMRRHVMRGKNIGKKFHRASRFHLQNVVYPMNCDHKPCISERTVTLGTVDGRFGDPILSSSLPMVEVSPRSLRIINQFFDLTSERLYPTTLGYSLDEAKLSWLRLLCTDEAAYHCNISLMQACNEIFLANGSITTEARHHLSQAFSQTQRRLESPEALSDSTLGMIVSLITQEQIRCQSTAAEVHARGLQSIVELRGGLGQIDGNLTLVLRVCKADILLSLQYGRPTMFFRDRMDEVWKKLASRGCRLDYAPVLPCNNLAPNIQNVLLDTMRICYLLNSNQRQPILDLMGFEEIFVSLCYRLLAFISMTDSTCQMDLKVACHLGLLTFIMTTFFQIGRGRIIEFEALSLRLQDLLSNDLCDLEHDISLWLMTVGGIWCSKGVQNDRFTAKLRTLARKRGIDSWSDFRGCLAKFPWIHALHDQLAHRLWSQI